MAFCWAAAISILASVTSSTLPAPPPAAPQVSLPALTEGQQLLVRTTARTFRLTVIDPRTGETRAAVSTDGVHFSQPARVYFLGATQGRQSGLGEMLVLMGAIRPGLRMELGLGSLSRFDRALSEPVTDIRVLSPATE
ncbi:MAG: hypothetical protein RIC55_10015 [Pirellulaceae bacterium]